MSYYRLVISRAFAKTKEFWNLHQVWKWVSTPVSAVLLRLAIKRLSPVMGWEGFLKEALLFSVCGFIVSWAGSYLMNLVQVPPLIHAEQQSEMVRLNDEMQRIKEAEFERSKLDFDFRLYAEPVSSTRIDLKITPAQRASVSMPMLCLKIWNRGKSHLQISTCKLSSESSSDPTTIQTDVHIKPDGDGFMDVTEQMAAFLFVQRDWQGFSDTHEVHIEVECINQFGQRASKDKSYKLQIKKTGGFSFAFSISPL
jgi:hypothetical protein